MRWKRWRSAVGWLHVPTTGAELLQVDSISFLWLLSRSWHYWKVTLLICKKQGFLFSFFSESLPQNNSHTIKMDPIGKTALFWLIVSFMTSVFFAAMETSWIRTNYRLMHIFRQTVLISIANTYCIRQISTFNLLSAGHIDNRLYEIPPWP